MLALAILASPAAAQDSDPRPILWNNLRVGMTKAEVKALYPKLETNLAADCPVDIWPNYNRAGLKGVKLSTGTMCERATQTIAALTAKYGEPRKEDLRVGFRPQLVPTESHYYWATPGTTIHLWHRIGGETFDLEYTEAESVNADVL